MTPGSFLKCQLQIVECYGHKAVEYGENHDIGITNNLSRQIFLSTLYSEDFAEEPSLSHQWDCFC